MPEFRVREYADYDAYVREWAADTLDHHGITLQEARDQQLIDEQELCLRWQLLGELDSDEILVALPEWLAEEKVGFVNGRVPTEFVGRIERETEKAIHLGDATAAPPLIRLAHRIHRLEEGLANADEDDERRDWLRARLDEKRAVFRDRDDLPCLHDEWLPKSQLLRVVRRTS